MDTEAVKERLNMHLKRKLVTTPPNIGTAYFHHQHPSSPFAAENLASPPGRPSAAASISPPAPNVSSRSARSSPRKLTASGARFAVRRPLHSSNESLNSLASSSQSTPAHTPLNRSAAATPTHHLTHSGGPQPAAESPAAAQHQQSPDTLTATLNAKKLSMMLDPEVIAVLRVLHEQLDRNANAVPVPPSVHGKRSSSGSAKATGL